MEGKDPMEMIQEVVIVGGGIAGLTTSLGLHRLGIGSLVLESSDRMRISGFAFTTWTNAWRALDAIGIGDSLRHQHNQLHGIVTMSSISGLAVSELSFETIGASGHHEARCVKRKVLMEGLVNELPSGTIRYSSKVAYIEDSGIFKLVHLADGSTIKTKVLIGCDGVNSVVAKWLGFKNPNFVGRCAIRGYAEFKGSHGFEPKMVQMVGKGVRFGFIPCDDSTVYWFFTFISASHENDFDENPPEMKGFVLSKLDKIPEKVKEIIDITKLDDIVCSPLRFRNPWELLWGNISKGNVCVAGDALHPMTPDIGQGGCAALEDGVVLARCLGQALSKKFDDNITEQDEYKKIEMGLKNFAKERRWRSIELIVTSYVVGYIQQSNGKVMKFLREKFLGKHLPGLLLKRADFKCGNLCGN